MRLQLIFLVVTVVLGVANILLTVYNAGSAGKNECQETTLNVKGQ
jgi:hypothetical protein